MTGKEQRSSHGKTWSRTPSSGLDLKKKMEETKTPVSPPGQMHNWNTTQNNLGGITTTFV